MRSLYFFLVILVSGMKVFAQWSVLTDVSHHFGNTAYRYEALAAAPSAPEDVYPIASELEFPLDAWLAGIEAGLKRSGGKWELGAALAVNISDPSDKMIDDDWRRERWIQHTESGTDLSLLLASVSARRHLVTLGAVPISLAANISYEKISEDMTGYEGWYYNDLLQAELPISGTEPSMAYDVTYLSPQTGLTVQFSMPWALTLDARCAAGVVFAWDTNDHLLRGKRAKGDATGFGTSSTLELSRSLFSLGRVPVEIGLRGDFRYYRADGTSTQTWYRDEQTNDGTTPAGTQYSGLPHDFRSTKYGFGIALKMKL